MTSEGWKVETYRTGKGTGPYQLISVQVIKHIESSMLHPGYQLASELRRIFAK